MLNLGCVEDAYEIVNSTLLLKDLDSARRHLFKILALAENDKFQSSISSTNIFSPEVAIGHNGNVFLLGGAHKIKNFVRGEVVPTDSSVKNFYNNITSRAEYCLQKDIQYAHIIFPDKHVILVKDFPYKQKYTLADYYLAKKSSIIANERGLSIIYPKKELIARNDLGGLNNAVTIKGDSHLSDAGYLVIVQKLLDVLEPEKQEHYMAFLLEQNKHQFKEVKWSGDLAIKFDPPPTTTRLIYKHMHDSQPIDNGVMSNDGLVRFWSNKSALSKKTILIFSDSYFNFIARYLSLIYSKVYFCRTRFMHNEVVDEISPDIVLTGNAERYLSLVSSDNKASYFNNYYKNVPVKESSYQEFNEELASVGHSSLLVPHNMEK